MVYIPKYAETMRCTQEEFSTKFNSKMMINF